MNEIQDSLMECIRRADRAGAGRLLATEAAGQGYERVLVEVVEPVLLRIGEAWRTQESFSLAQAYVAAKVAEDVLSSIAAQPERRAGASAAPGVAVIGNIEEDFHALGRRMLGTFLQTGGWRVRDLGNDVPAADFVDVAVREGARVIGVSAMMLTTARNIRQVREELDRRRLAGRIQLAVGGAVFLVRPGLVEEVGGDGTAPNALRAVRLFDELQARSLRTEAGV